MSDVANGATEFELFSYDTSFNGKYVGQAPGLPGSSAGVVLLAGKGGVNTSCRTGQGC